MAFDFSKLNFFSRLDARARVFVLFAVVIGVGVGVYLLSTLMSSDNAALGPSTAASAPSGLQSVPGAKLDPEFGRAVREANEQAARDATMSGGSAVATIVNTGQQASSDVQCTVLCGDESANVKDSLNTWVKQGKLGSAISNQLQELANKDVSLAEYRAALDKLVISGAMTPEQARASLDDYAKQHANRAAAESAKTLDDYIKRGKLPLDAANQLLAAQKKNVTPSEYKEMLDKMVREGKLDSATAQRLLNQYMQQRSREIVMRSVVALRGMIGAGITADVEKELEALEMRMVGVDEYQQKLQGYVDAGKMTPSVSKSILDEFKQQKLDMGDVSSMGSLLDQAREDAYQELRDLQRDNKITPETAATIKDMIDRKVSTTTFESGIAELQQEGKLTPEIAKLKLADYKKIQDLQLLSDQLDTLRNNNAPCTDQEEPLKQAVAAGALTPDQAAQLMSECQAGQIKAEVKEVEGTGELADLRRRLEAAKGTQTVATNTFRPEDFAAVTTQNQQELAQQRQARIEATVAAMSGQASQLLAAWAPPVMLHKDGTPPEDKTKNKTQTGEAAGTSETNAAAGSAASSEPAAAPIIKAGTIIFAVLDTAVNSDYPDSPVLATVVEGKYKGAKLLGKLVTTKGVSGQMDRITLNFTLMNMDAWPKSKTATAYGIDPDTARSALASEVNYHYMQRFGALMATSFLQGYGQAVTSSGGSATQSAFGTSTTNPELSPSGKLASAFGQMAQALGQATKNYTERPPTVIVDSGVGLGILFMTDVT